MICAGLSLFGNPHAEAHDILARGSGIARVAPAFEAALASEPPGSKAAPVVKSFVAKRLAWDKRPELFVCFWNGPEALRRKVLAIASELIAGRPIAFVGVAAGSIKQCTVSDYRQYDIRVSLIANASLLADGDDPSSFFSVIGQASRIDIRKATLNLPFRPEHSENTIRNKTLHEFCHALGCLHEHQRQECAKEFDDKQIKSALNLSDKEYAENFEYIPSTDAYYRPEQVGIFDKDSVMLYSFYDWMFRDTKTAQCFRSQEVTTLSPGDKAGLAMLYSNASAISLDIPPTVSGFAAKAAELKSRATELQLSATLLRGETRARMLSQAPQSAHAAILDNLDTQAVAHDVEIERLREEAAQYQLHPETLQRLEEALRLYGAH